MTLLLHKHELAKQAWLTLPVSISVMATFMPCTLTGAFLNNIQEITVLVVKKLIEERTGLPPGEQRLIFEGKQLEDEKKLSAYRISNNATIFLVMRLVGGAKRPAQPTVRKVDPSIPRSQEECMIMYTDDDNVKMPCGHTISPASLIDHSWNEICVNKKTEVHCCLCNTIWDLDTIRRYGGATTEEITILRECVSLNFCQNDPKISECPSCHNFCERLDESNSCVVCRVCTRVKKKTYHFCWDCKREWIGSPTNKRCGNDKCNAQEILEKLKNCPEIEMPYLKTVKVPSIRACPSCGSLIEHGGQCKHITCKACTNEFCFVCLRIRDGGSWSCGSFNTPCSVAPRQTIIPTRN